jgi:5-methylcytosine-specific restriction endonuclease McrA
LSENRSGPDAPIWNEDSVGWYGPNWQEKRAKRVERDGHQCVVCKMSNEEHKEEYGRALNVHHIQPLSSFREEDERVDYDRANRLENLITLCCKCHGRWEGIPLRPQVDQ